jgi:hypothetical protein
MNPNSWMSFALISWLRISLYNAKKILEEFNSSDTGREF